MNDTEKRIITNVIERLRGERASGEVVQALTEEPLSLYLQSWVIPALELLVKKNRTRWDLRDADELAR